MSVTRALDSLASVGVVDEACYPWVPGGARCLGSLRGLEDPGHEDRRLRSSDPARRHEELARDAGALVATMTAYEDLLAYTGGIYEHLEGQNGYGHCISCVGYNDIDKYWICKNSWGEWGEHGFFRIRYGECGIGAEMWGVSLG
jgi:hypothetical protein